MKNKVMLMIVALILSQLALVGCQKKTVEPEVKNTVADSTLDTSTLSGEPFTTADLAENKLTVLNIWATWCPPCVAELPELQKVNEQFGELGVEVVGVLQDGIGQTGEQVPEVIASAETLLADANASYRVVLPDEYLQQEFIAGMQYFPTTFFLDEKGTVLKTVTGAHNYADWSDLIDEVLEEMEN